MALLGKGGILYNALAIVIAILFPIIAVLCAFVEGIYELIKFVVRKVWSWISW